METEQPKRAIVRRFESGPDGRLYDVEERIHLQGLLLEQMSREMDMMVEIMMTMDCKFEAVFEEIDVLQRRTPPVRVRRGRFRRLGEPPAL